MKGVSSLSRPGLQKLLDTWSQNGKVEWIGVREKKRAALTELQSVAAIAGKGLQGDHYAGRSGKRAVTLIQAEHIQAIAALLHVDNVHPQQMRRNIVISGINLLALKGKQFSLGEAVLEMTGLCHPCSRMEENLGAGGYNAVRGHGGINAKILLSGEIKLGDELIALDSRPG